MNKSLSKKEQSAVARIGKSGFRGVRYSGHKAKPWYVDFMHKGKTYYGGIYETQKEAAIAYDNLVTKVAGDKAITNKQLGLLDNPEELIEKNSEVEISDHLLSIAMNFCKYLDKRKSKTGKFLEFSRAELKQKLTIKEVATIINYLEQDGIATLSNKAMAKQISELSQAKKEEIKNGDVIRKTLSPLILNVCQAKGKYNRLLEQQLDAMTELDNAINALKDALKFNNQAAH